MSEHPIEVLMKTAMESIKDMVDVNTVVGDPIETPDGYVIVPVSRVSAGFAAGGSDYDINNGGNNGNGPLPFGGGSGAGVSVKPVGFLVVGKQQVRLIPVDKNAVVDRVLDVAPQVVEKIQQIISGKKNKANTAQTQTTTMKKTVVTTPENNS
ncbi:MAG: hypothetical protein PWP31_178 [Clostridia bacterium]|nr:hypothetical protein [Clostridia bacterium]